MCDLKKILETTPEPVLIDGDEMRQFRSLFEFLLFASAVRC